MTFYLVINGYGEPLYNKKTGQIHLYMTEMNALKRIKRTFIKDYLTGRKRVVVRKAIMVEL